MDSLATNAVVARKASANKSVLVRTARQCSHDECTNNAVIGGVCRRHGAKAKKCNHADCTNNVVSGSVCRRHGAEARRCRYPECTNNVQIGGLCCKHGAKKKKCRHPQCNSVAVKDGVCYRHGAKRKMCNYPDCSKNAVKGGVCRRHGAENKVELPNGVCQCHGICMKTNHSLLEQERHDETYGNSCSSLETEHNNDRLTACHSLLSFVGTNNVERNIASVTQPAQKQRSRDSRDQEEIDLDTILQVPHYVSDNFRKVGFAKCENDNLFPVLFIGPNEAPSYIRREWQARLNQHLRQGARMAHLVAFYGRELEIDKFGLVYEGYLYDEYLENVFLKNPERQIQAKAIQQGKALNPRELNFNLAILELSLARSLPEEYRWTWKPSPIFLCVTH